MHLVQVNVDQLLILCGDGQGVVPIPAAASPSASSAKPPEEAARSSLCCPQNFPVLMREHATDTDLGTTSILTSATSNNRWLSSEGTSRLHVEILSGSNPGTRRSFGMRGMYTTPIPSRCKSAVSSSSSKRAETSSAEVDDPIQTSQELSDCGRASEPGDSVDFGFMRGIHAHGCQRTFR